MNPIATSVMNSLVPTHVRNVAKKLSGLVKKHLFKTLRLSEIFEQSAEASRV